MYDTLTFNNPNGFKFQFGEMDTDKEIPLIYEDNDKESIHYLTIEQCKEIVNHFQKYIDLVE